MYAQVLQPLPFVQYISGKRMTSMRILHLIVPILSIFNQRQLRAGIITFLFFFCFSPLVHDIHSLLGLDQHRTLLDYKKHCSTLHDNPI